MPDFGPNWNLNQSISNRRSQKQIEAEQDYLYNTTANKEVEDTMLDFLIPSMVSLFGLDFLAHLMHIETAIDEMKNVDRWVFDPMRNRAPQPQINPTKKEVPHTIHKNLNAPIPKSRSFGNLKRKFKN